jgi:hypothetical protein
MIRRGDSLKILEVGSLVVFGALTAYTLLAAPAGRWPPSGSRSTRACS